MAEDTFLKSQALTQRPEMMAQQHGFQASQNLGLSIGQSAKNYLQAYQAEQEMAMRGAMGREQLVTEGLRQEELQAKIMMTNSGLDLRIKEGQLDLQNAQLENYKSQIKDRDNPKPPASVMGKIYQDEEGYYTFGPTGIHRFGSAAEAQRFQMLQKPGDEQDVGQSMRQMQIIGDHYGDIESQYKSGAGTVSDERMNTEREIYERARAAELGPVVSMMQTQEEKLDASAASFINGMADIPDFTNGLISVRNETGVTEQEVQEAVMDFVRNAFMREPKVPVNEIRVKMVGPDRATFFAALVQAIRGGE